MAPLYSYSGWCCCGHPYPDWGTVVPVSGGGHTLVFTIDPQTGQSCNENSGGPFAAIGTGAWSSVTPFDIE